MNFSNSNLLIGYFEYGCSTTAKNNNSLNRISSSGSFLSVSYKFTNKFTCRKIFRMLHNQPKVGPKPWWIVWRIFWLLADLQVFYINQTLLASRGSSHSARYLFRGYAKRTWSEYVLQTNFIMLSLKFKIASSYPCLHSFKVHFRTSPGVFNESFEVDFHNVLLYLSNREIKCE